MDEKTISIVKKTVEELLEKMGFSGEITIAQDDTEDNIFCNIETNEDSNFLIGQHGTNLQALQHLTRLIVRKHIPEKIRFTLDVNSYKQQKNQTIIEQARQVAQDVLNQSKPIAMMPMSTYERRIAHLELSKNSSVIAESIGEGEARKIIVRPASMIN